MKEFRLGRSEYRFDPTASEAIARADQKPVSIGGEGSSYHASAAEVQKFEGFTFEPDRLISTKEIGQQRWIRSNRTS